MSEYKTLFERALNSKQILPGEFALLNSSAQHIFEREGGIVHESSASLFEPGESKLDRMAVAGGCTVEDMVKLTYDQRKEFRANNWRLF